MRTPNAKCAICDKPLYRRPYELAKTRYAACRPHREEAARLAGVTAAQSRGLVAGRKKGTNHREGYRHREESKSKAAVANRKFWTANPEKAAARGAKSGGELHYRWKGGASKLNLSIRRMTENRRWMDAVKARDGKCVRCGSTEKLESHHRKPLAEIISECGIKSRDDAKRFAAAVWDVTNGITLCELCHYAEHGRTHRDDSRADVQVAPAPPPGAVR